MFVPELEELKVGVAYGPLKIIFLIFSFRLLIEDIEEFLLIILKVSLIKIPFIFDFAQRNIFRWRIVV
jgi:hypothetical protein